ncbi:hypothetical protein FGI60_09310 [Brucella haematophila]|nr:hypothetical protein FGI60_09310 [Brucella haematophila]
MKTESLYLFVFTHYPTHRSRIRNQSSELISLRRRYALLLEVLYRKRKRRPESIGPAFCIG